jgi:hypothetical protein
MVGPRGRAVAARVLVVVTKDQDFCDGHLLASPSAYS